MSGQAREFAHGLMFHRFHRAGTKPQGQGSITEKDLERLLQDIGLSNILTPQEWMRKTESNALEPQHICLTFDDGLKSQIEVALPVLDRHGLKAFWFIFSSVFEGNIDRNEVYNRLATSEFPTFDDFVEDFFRFHPVEPAMFRDPAFLSFEKNARALFPFYSDSDLRFRYFRNKMLPRPEFEKIMDRYMETKLKSRGKTLNDVSQGIWMDSGDLLNLSRDGHLIGLHSYSHPFELAGLTLDEQALQYKKNFEHIRDCTGTAPVSMSHPLNSYQPETLTVLSKLGIRCGFRSNMQPRQGQKINPNPLELAREDPINLLRKT